MALVKVKWPSAEGWAMAEESEVGTLYELYEEPTPPPKSTTKTKASESEPVPSS